MKILCAHLRSQRLLISVYSSHLILSHILDTVAISA